MPTPKAYNLTDPMALKWSERAYDLLEQGELKASITSVGGVKTARVDGTCPYCEDVIHYVQVLEASTEGTQGILAPDLTKEGPHYSAITVTCGCGRPHSDDPKSGTGCGTTFRIEVLVS